jgi:hypothetical protein
MGNVQNFVWLRWTLLTEYPGKFFTIPVVLLVQALFLFGLGLIGGNPITIVVLVYLSYMFVLAAIVYLVALMLFRRPDRERT